MSNWNHIDERECRSIEAILPQYIENLLAARTMLDVESHLTRCPECSLQCRQLESTVKLLQSANRFETNDDFMAKLHSRLDSIQPERALHIPSLSSLRELISNMIQTRTAPILGVGMAMAGIITFAFLYHPMPKSVNTPANARIGVEQPLQRNVALAAVNPFDDPIAANLEAHSAILENSAVTVTNSE